MSSVTRSTVCPKVPLKTKVPLFWAVGGWIPKPFGLVVAHIGGFHVGSKVALFTAKRSDVYLIPFRPYFEYEKITEKSHYAQMKFRM